MAITATNINTGGAVVYVGGTVSGSANADGYYDMEVEGTDVGCTQGGVTVSYSLETSDIFCDQVLTPVDVAITGETATVEFEMLETNAENIKLVMGSQASSTDGASAFFVGLGGLSTLTFQPLQLKITDNDTAYLTYWTFYRTMSGGFDIGFERENPSALSITLTAYGDTNHASGKQLFQIKENKS
jgi:hypothetical protein